MNGPPRRRRFSRNWYTCWGPERGGCMQAHDDVGEAQECIDVDAIACHERGDVTDRTIRAIDRPQAARLFDVVTGPGWRPSYEELL